MGKLILYTLVVFIATASGASTGLGGGVMIKPIFDLVSNSTTSTINFYSSLAVFIMAIVSLGKQFRQKFKFDFKPLLTISVGAILGGFVGQQLLQNVTTVMTPIHVKLLQSAMIFAVMLIVMVYNLVKKHLVSFHLKNFLLILMVGLCLGMVSVFLGIGGGPINVAITMLLFSFSLREAAVYSVGIIFFSQFTKMITIIISPIKPVIDVGVAIAVVVAAIIGGYAGAWINRHASARLLNGVYNFLLCCMIALTLFNTLRYAGII